MNLYSCLLPCIIFVTVVITFRIGHLDDTVLMCSTLHSAGVNSKHTFISLSSSSKSRTSCSWTQTLTITHGLQKLTALACHFHPATTFTHNILKVTCKQRRRSLSTVGGGHAVANQPSPTTVLLSCDVLLRTTYLLSGMKS